MDYEFTFPVQVKDRIGMSEWSKVGAGTRQSLRDWVYKGVRLRSGRRLKLPTFRLAGRTYTTKQAYDWWMKQQQEA